MPEIWNAMMEPLHSDAVPQDAAEQESLQTQVFTEDAETLQRALEAVLFVAVEPLSVKELSRILDADEKTVRETAEALVAVYADRGFVLRRVAGGYQFVTPEAYMPYVEKLYRPKVQQLSNAAMETLAIVAYKQPITRAEISAIRQVDSDGTINRLLEKKLIKEVGRVNNAGRAVLYGTGDEFLTFFGLNSLKDLPDMEQKEEQEHFIL